MHSMQSRVFPSGGDLHTLLLELYLMHKLHLLHNLCAELPDKLLELMHKL